MVSPARPANVRPGSVSPGVGLTRTRLIQIVGATLVLLLIPAYVQLLLALARLGRVENLAGFLKETGAAFVTGQVNAFFMLAFLSHQTLMTLDAILRTVVRLAVTRRRLLEWETSAQAETGAGRRTPVTP